MRTKTKEKVEFGDFQTPVELTRTVCDVLRGLGVSPRSIVEPTCGKGAFLRASVDAFPQCETFVGFEVNPLHVEQAESVDRAEIHCANFFDMDWVGVLRDFHDPILVVGNPPWVTNSAVGTLRGANLPFKSNYQRLSGLDAVTGKSNFDISEWMLLHLLTCLSGRSGVLAMLCKTAIARKVLRQAWCKELQVARSITYSIDAAQYFGAAVEACLLVCFLEQGATSGECATYPNLEASRIGSTFALRGGRLVADVDAAGKYGHLFGKSPLRWRSGVKHDCARVMELRINGSSEFENGLGEVVSLESTYLYPMLKSSDLNRSAPVPSRVMIVTQRWVGDDTRRIEREAPRTWSYLQSHASSLDGRASLIYRNQYRFSMFGIGPYSYSPWKVAISGFYKNLEFRIIGPFNDKPVMLDDTCYFLPARSQADADTLVNLLSSEAAKGFFHSFVFWDEKRPITTQLLAALDIGALAEEVGVSLPTWSDTPQQMSLFDT